MGVLIYWEKKTTPVELIGVDLGRGGKRVPKFRLLKKEGNKEKARKFTAKKWQRG